MFRYGIDHEALIDVTKRLKVVVTLSFTLHLVAFLGHSVAYVRQVVTLVWIQLLRLYSHIWYLVLVDDHG